MTADEAKIESALRECASHIRHLERCSVALKKFFPLDDESFQELSDDEIQVLDQFLYRFAKLQDAMGAKLFTPLASILIGIDKPRPFLDTLNTLEKFELLPSVDVWQELRTLRNNLAHEYPEQVGQTVETLNLLLEKWHTLADIFAVMKGYVLK